MGNVVVYLPAAVERQLADEGHDPADWLRREVKRLVARQFPQEGGARTAGADPHFKPHPKPEAKPKAARRR